MRAIVVAGLPRAGKDSFARVLPWKKIVYSDLIKAIAGIRDVTDKKELGRIADKLREENGKDYLTRYALAIADEAGENTIVLVGPRTPEEVRYVKENISEHTVVWIEADEEIRRKRGADPEREREDIGRGLAEIRNLADVIVENNGTPEELKERAKYFVENINYYLIGLKSGIEIHQQLDTHKLFCSCPSTLRDDEPGVVVERFQRPVASEMGTFDPAALAEFRKGRKYIYQAYSDTTCLVELDEEPPHPPNDEAIDITLTFAEFVHATPVDASIVMRKMVIDGSNTSGFQRTMLLATGGWIEGHLSKIRIQTICLEEDSARPIERGEDKIVYRVDRLGIPLIEIATGPDMHTPEEIKEAAERIGVLLRATGRVKRGLGTIRQDLNISIRGGARVEIKGAQDLDLIPEYVKNEVRRQKGLLEIKEEMQKRELTERDFDLPIVDVTDLLEDTEAKFVRSTIKKGGKVLGIRVPKMSGLLGKEIQNGKRFGTELSYYAKVYGKVGGILHSDELPKYGISADEVQKIRERLNCEEEDAFVIVVAPEENARNALDAVKKRLKMALHGVPEETRGPNPDGTTRFMRPLPGAARMYPETDVAPVFITEDRLQRIRKNLPPLPEERYEEYRRMGLNEEQARTLVKSRHVFLFDEIVSEGVDPKTAANILLTFLPYWKRQGWELTEDQIKDLALGYNRKYPKEALDEIVPEIAKGKKLDEVLKEKGIEMIDEEKIREVVERIVKEFRERGEEPRMNVIMGRAMAELKGKAPGKVVARTVREILPGS
ncbi:MAG: Glu-tRNA(Gln) amidotransferase subunit GatE [Candidatus Diapherotrites archaeon]|nr:Glu-tRNA(Gln) amidotransferase subunit GatE [Candidatus Diapherotrites archaeon]